MVDKRTAIIGVSGQEKPRSYQACSPSEPPPTNILRMTTSTTLDSHFLLWEETWIGDNDGVKNLFGVVNGDMPNLADRRLYEKALEAVSGCDVEDRTDYATEQAVSVPSSR